MTKIKSRTFEESIQRLENIVDELESDETTLATSLDLYSEGVVLLEECVKGLRETELKLQELKKRNDGVFESLDIKD